MSDYICNNPPCQPDDLEIKWETIESWILFQIYKSNWSFRDNISCVWKGWICEWFKPKARTFSLSSILTFYSTHRALARLQCSSPRLGKFQGKREKSQYLVVNLYISALDFRTIPYQGNECLIQNWKLGLHYIWWLKAWDSMTKTYESFGRFSSDYLKMLKKGIGENIWLLLPYFDLHFLAWLFEEDVEVEIWYWIRSYIVAHFFCISNHLKRMFLWLLQN